MPVTKLAFALILWASFLCQSQLAFSWSGSVHREIGVNVRALLSPSEAQYFDGLAKSLIDDARDLSSLSPWVDSVRGTPIFELFESDVPEALEGFSRRHSSRWHYENSFYHGSLHIHGTEKKHPCRMTNAGQLEEALLAVDQALQQKTTQHQEAMLVAFAMHLLEDLHQPLHTTTLVRSDCSHDRGGNLYCLQKLSGRCVMNLHQLWDQGFSVSKNSRFMASIELGAPPSLPLSTEIALLRAKGEDLAKKVYETQENRMPHDNYLRWAKPVAEQQIKLSVQRVAHYLKKHYERNTQK